MIGERYIKEWAATHPWRRAEQVEQDLLLSFASVGRNLFRPVPFRKACVPGRYSFA